MNYTAKIDGFTFQIPDVGTRDTIEKNVSEPDMPFSSGAMPEPMGIKSRTVQCTCLFINDNYDAHVDFIAHILQDLINTFIHPKYGPLRGVIKNIVVNNDSRKRYAAIDIDFIESADESTEPVRQTDIKYQTEQVISEAQKQQVQQLEDDLRKDLGPASQMLVSTKNIVSKIPLLSQFTNLSWAARRLVSKIDDDVSVLNGALTTIAQPADSIIASIEYATTLPGVVIGSVARCVERYAEAAVQVSGSPLSFVMSFRTSMNDLLSSLNVLRTPAMVSAVQIESLYIADLYRKDEDSRLKLERVENSKVWNDDGSLNYVDTAPQVLSMNDLEKSLKQTRTDIQAAIDTVRNETGSPELIYLLKTIAADLLQYVDKVKLTREKIIEINLDHEIPVHAICLRYGLPFMAAERVCAINSFMNPNFCSGVVRVYVR
jgi:prophage DNA circulation protein